jgi:DNA-binding transcriptional MerR regulator
VTVWAARRLLRRQGMPPEEIRAVLAPGDPVIARRLLELHRERLEEWIEEQRGLLVEVERAVTTVSLEPGIDPSVCTARRRWTTVPEGDVVPR